MAEIVALINPGNQDLIGFTYTAKLQEELIVQGYQVVNVNSETEARVYNPALVLKVHGAMDIYKRDRGYLIKARKYSDLVVCFMTALEYVGIPKSTDTGYLVDESLLVDLDIVIGFNTSQEDTTCLLAKVDTFCEKFHREVLSPGKYKKVYEDKILTVDPDFQDNTVKPDTWGDNTDGSFGIVFASVDDVPANVLRLTKHGSSSRPYRVSVPYLASDPDSKHMLMFSARVLPGNSSQVVQVYCGGSRIDVEVNTNTFTRFTYEFYPTNHHNMHLDSVGFDLCVSPPVNRRSGVPFYIDVNSSSFRLDETLGFIMNVRSTYPLHFSLSRPGSVDIAGVWVCKKGMLDILDDPEQIYTPYPNVFSDYKSVADSGGVPVASKLTTTDTVPLTVTMKASSEPKNDYSSFLSSGMAAVSNTENLIKSYTSGYTEIMKSLSALSSGGSLKFLNVDDLKIDFSGVEASLADTSLPFEKRESLQKMVTKMQSIARATENLKTIDTSSIKGAMSDAGYLNDSYVKEAVVNVGTKLQEVNQAIEQVSSRIASATSEAISSTTTSSSSPIPGAISALNGKSVSNPLANDSAIIGAVQGALSKQQAALGKVSATAAEISSKLNKLYPKISSVLTQPRSMEQGCLGTTGIATGKDSTVDSITGKVTPTPSGGQVAGVDYTRYWGNI